MMSKISLIKSAWNQNICFKLWFKITWFSGINYIIVQCTQDRLCMERKPERRECHRIYMQGHTNIQWDTSPHQWWNAKMQYMQCNGWSKGKEWSYYNVYTERADMDLWTPHRRCKTHVEKADMDLYNEVPPERPSFSFWLLGLVSHASSLNHIYHATIELCWFFQYTLTWYIS